MTRRARGPFRARLQFDRLEDRAMPAGFDPGRILVTFNDSANEAGHLAALVQSPVSEGASRLGFGLYEVDLTAGVSVDTGRARLSGIAGVVATSPDFRVFPDAVANDPQVGSQWSLASTGINARAAWSVSTGTGRTIVAVIDTGVDYTHPDLARNIWRNPREIAGNDVDDDGNGFVDDVFGANFATNNGNPMDDGGHGTHVAGIIGAVGNNGIGVSGVAWTTQIMALRFMSATTGGYTSDAVRAMDYAIANGAKILNVSWGGGDVYQPLQAAMARARSAGAIVVAAAGNNARNTDSTPFYPAGYIAGLDNVVTVAATDSADNLASYSNYGPGTVTIAAPGSSILSTLSGGGYGTKSGTSMAAPFVSGALALLWDKNPTWSYQQIVAKLKLSVDTLSSLSGKVATGGRIDLAKLLDVPPPAPPVVPPPASPPPAIGDTVGPRVLSATFNGSKAGSFDRVRVKFSESINLATFTASAIAISGPTGTLTVSAILPVSGTNNTQFQLMFSKIQTISGSYTVALGPTIRDVAGNAMDQNFNGINAEVGDTYILSATLVGTPAVPPVVPPPPSPPVAAVPTSRISYTGPAAPVAINDSRTTRIEFTVTDNITVTDLNVLVNLTHGRLGDLNFRIVAPDGRAVTLFNRRGGSGANLNLTFDDQATLGLASGTAPFTGSYRPEQLLSLFNGMNARGVWSLQIFDLAAGFTGTVNSVSLSFASPAAASTSVRPVSVTARDLMGATDDVKDAVLKGRGDVLATRSIAPPIEGSVLSGAKPLAVGVVKR